MNECGNKDANIILKSDQEPAIKYLVSDVQRGRTGAKTMVEESPKKSSGSNGIVERAIQACEGQIRSFKSQLDDRYKVHIAVEHPIVAWLCEHTAYLLNRLEVGHDGKTAYERMKGKHATVLGVEFGEQLTWKQKPIGVMSKLTTQWSCGISIGINRSSGEFIVAGQNEGIKYARTVRRVPIQSRWVIENLEWVKFTPWNLGAGDALAEGELSRLDFKAGPGVRMTEDELEKVLFGPSQDASFQEGFC